MEESNKKEEEILENIAEKIKEGFKNVTYTIERVETGEEERKREEMKKDWRQVMLSQHSLFGILAGFEITALTVFGNQIGISLEKWIFSFVILFIFI